MKTHAMLSTILLVVCSLYSGANWARGHFGFYFGIPLYPYNPYPYYPYQYPYYPYHYYPYQYPYYYPPTVPATPPVYIQQSPQAGQQYPSGYWYYCNNPKGYYPYIKQCPRGWQEVEPTPPALR
ncbi:MAG: hypothetical protein PHF31_11805 [Methylobacter sp.]|nr:hypothetical protein [Methylobacter sp.]